MSHHIARAAEIIALRQEFCRELRSGMWRQITGVFHGRINGLDHFCVRGLAGYLYGHGNEDDLRRTAAYSVLCAENRLGISRDDADKLATLNNDGMSFYCLADVIEKLPLAC